MSNLFNNTLVQVSLTKPQIEALIRQEVGKSFPNFVADKISFNVSTQTDMRHEVSGTTFEGVDIVLKPLETSNYWDR